MNVIASVDGSVWTSVFLNNLSVRAIGSRASDAAIRAAMNTTLPGIAMKFRFTIASSGAGCGTTGGIFSTARCSSGIGMLSAGKLRYLAMAGRAVTKMRTDAMMNGDHPFSTATAEWRVTIGPDMVVVATFDGTCAIGGLDVADPPSTSNTTGGCQIL